MSHNNPFRLGFVALFETPIDRPEIAAFTASWLERFDQLEQVCAGVDATTILSEPGDIQWSDNLQFRVLQGAQFSWVYITRGRKVIETTGEPNGEEPSLSLTLLIGLPGVKEIVPDSDERRLEELERAGLL